MLHFSVSGKACLSVCAVTLLAYSKLEARVLIGEWLRSIIGYDCIVVCAIDHQLLNLYALQSVSTPNELLDITH